MEQLNKIRKAMEAVVLEAGKSLMDREKSSKVYKKGYADYVTEVDLYVQNIISTRLLKEFPHIQFMGEEQDNSNPDPEKPLWILDPVDGTSNLIHDMKMSVISLALVEQGKAVAGVIYQPYNRELFSAAKGMGAFLNGEPISVSKPETLSASIIALGTSPYHHELGEQTFDAAKRVFMASMDIRRSGAAAMDLAYIAAGRLDGMFELLLQPWDVAAGQILVEEAGGKVTTLQGTPLGLMEGSSVLVSNGKIHEELKRIVNNQ